MVGRVLADRYEIHRLLGVGGMGRVYAGRQRTLDRPVAIKCIHPHLLSHEATLVRFAEEARVASQLRHPNIVKVYDFGRTSGPDPRTFFIVMELLSGPDLASVIERHGPMPVPRALAILRQILGALGEAHAHGVSHRDAKPDNVILESSPGRGEHVKIIDFGIAKVHGARGVTAIGQFVGSPQYMPPEQIQGHSGEIRSDLYAAGVTFFQLLTGCHPFDADTLTGVLHRQLYARRPDPREVAPDAEIPDAVAEVCLQAIALDPGSRFQSADAFASALDAACEPVIPARRPASGPHRGETFDAVMRPARDTLVDALRPDATSDEPDALEEARLPCAELGDQDPLEAGLRMAERIARVALAHRESGRLDAAEQELLRGLELAERWRDAGCAAAAQEAVPTCRRLLGVVLREQGRHVESEDALRAALDAVQLPCSARAHALAELVSTLAELGRAAEAEACRVQALRLAGQLGERELTLRLRRQAQDLARLAAARPRGAAPFGSGAPPRLTSELRMTSEIDVPHGDTVPGSRSR